MQAAIDEANAGLAEGGIPIGSVLVIDGRIVGRGHNRRVQRGSAILHAETDAIEAAGRTNVLVGLDLARALGELGRLAPDARTEETARRRAETIRIEPSGAAVAIAEAVGSPPRAPSS
jgi:pyrimidine deaminase RibD-like protein